MTREVPSQQPCLQGVSGQNTLVHLERGIIIIVSVLYHNGKSPGNGIQEEHHPKTQHIPPEVVSFIHNVIK